MMPRATTPAVVPIAVVALSLWGCSWGSVEIRNDHVVNHGIYQAELLGAPWKRVMGFVDQSAPQNGINKLDDIVYFRCPERQTISIAQVRYVIPYRRGRPLFFNSPESATRYFFEDFLEATQAKTEPDPQFESYNVRELRAASVEFPTANAPQLCRTDRLDSPLPPMRSRVVSIWLPAGFRFTNLIVLQYTSPPETFDQSLKDFEHLIDSLSFQTD
jgi:hypothetical protein